MNNQINPNPQICCKKQIQIMISAGYIGDAIRKARKHQKISRKEIGNKMGVGKKQILRYENGSAVIPKDILFKLFLNGIGKC